VPFPSISQLSSPSTTELTLSRLPEKDGLLYWLVCAINARDKAKAKEAELVVSLAVKGVLMTGTIISRKAYISANPVLEMVDQKVNDLRRAGKLRGEPPSPDFIHLKNARISAPGRGPVPEQSEGGYWRVRIANVDGFSVG
jgi:hypothetical protein